MQSWNVPNPRRRTNGPNVPTGSNPVYSDPDDRGHEPLIGAVTEEHVIFYRHQSRTHHKKHLRDLFPDLWEITQLCRDVARARGCHARDVWVELSTSLRREATAAKAIAS